MAEAGATIAADGVTGVKLELEVELEAAVHVKGEPLECGVCGARRVDCCELAVARTELGSACGPLLAKYGPAVTARAPPRHLCASCLDLLALLERAEQEYLRLKDAFDEIIAKNPMYEIGALPPPAVKVEAADFGERADSEDEPLAVTKKRRHRKVDKRVKSNTKPYKRKPRTKKENVEENIQNSFTAVENEEEPVLKTVKKEESTEGSEQLNNTNDMYKLDIEFNEDDDDSDFFPEDTHNDSRSPPLLVPRRGRPKGSTMQKGKKNDTKTVYQCDQCDAKYTTAKRLEIHKEKHLEGKPPFICEVCGARYKHKRACDIHVGLHKGISDWKCEECNKLFPSKGALQRHNNIHTGKLNYQCDLCGKSFIHTSSFKMHKLSHSGLKPHACDVCGLALMTRSHLKRHKRIHSGEKRHECNVCGKRFSERYNLVAHSKSHEAAGEGAVVTAPRRRLFRCSFCQERFERRYMLERHVSTAHGRTLERAPATPRNTMSKLLKAQAQARAAVPAPPHPPPSLTPASDMTETKEERSPDSRASSGAPHKLQLVSTATIVTSGSWSGPFATEFGIRHDFPH